MPNQWQSGVSFQFHSNICNLFDWAIEARNSLLFHRPAPHRKWCAKFELFHNTHSHTCIPVYRANESNSLQNIFFIRLNNKLNRKMGSNCKGHRFWFEHQFFRWNIPKDVFFFWLNWREREFKSVFESGGDVCDFNFENWPLLCLHFAMFVKGAAEKQCRKTWLHVCTTFFLLHLHTLCVWFVWCIFQHKNIFIYL